MIHVRTTRHWRYREDPDGNAIRELPRGVVFSLPDPIGLLAIAEEAAEPTVPLTAQQAFELEVVRAARAGDEARLQALLSGPETAEPEPEPEPKKAAAAASVVRPKSGRSK